MSVEIPTVKLAGYLAWRASGSRQVPPEVIRACREVRDGFEDLGLLSVRDPRVDDVDRARFMDLMGRYYRQPMDVILADARPDIGFQVGVMPEFTERARPHTKLIARLPKGERPHLHGPKKDAKLRFFHRLGTPPARTRYKLLNADPVVPAAFRDEWLPTMNRWGNTMLTATETVLEMLALGYSLPRDFFTHLMQNGPHLLAPTGSYLDTHGRLGTNLARFHYDFNLVTIHGKSNSPGLFAWTRDWRRFPVRIPDGCLLLQAGQQMAYLTGGRVLAGFHEVVTVSEMAAFIAASRAKGVRPVRVSSTVFTHVASDRRLHPRGPFATKHAVRRYPSITAGRFALQELRAIAMSQ